MYKKIIVGWIGRDISMNDMSPVQLTAIWIEHCSNPFLLWEAKPLANILIFYKKDFEMLGGQYSNVQRKIRQWLMEAIQSNKSPGISR